jgi:dihydroneopterin aldolase
LGSFVFVDKIRLSGIVLFAHLGVYEAERETGQKIRIDLELEADLEAPARSDHLSHTVDYEKVYRLVESLVTTSRFRLLEALAGSLAGKLLESFPIQAATVRVQKPNVPFQGTMSAVEVELKRSR